MNPHHWMVRFVRDFWIFTLLILFVINTLIILGYQAFLEYRYEGPEEVIAEKYAGSIVLDHNTIEKITALLLEKPDGSLHVATLESHVLTGRFRVVHGGTGEVAQQPYRDTALAHTGMVTVNISDGAVAGLAVSPVGIRVMGVTLPLYYICCVAVLLTVEGIIYWRFLKIFGKE